MTVESAQQFAVQINAEFGINLNKLGCVMAETEVIDLKHFAPGIEDDLYTSPDPEKTWIHGDIASQGAHVTLLYGLLRPAYEYGELIDHLLADVLPKHVYISDVGIFESNFPDEPYGCLVAHIDKSEALVRTNDRLRYLPHVDTFPEWQPHLTLAYVKRERADYWKSVLNDKLDGKKLVIDHLNLGKVRL